MLGTLLVAWAIEAIGAMSGTTPTSLGMSELFSVSSSLGIGVGEADVAERPGRAWAQRGEETR